MTREHKPRLGRPPVNGETMPRRSIALPRYLWRELDREARKRSKPGAPVSAAEIIRSRLLSNPPRGGE